MSGYVPVQVTPDIMDDRRVDRMAAPPAAQGPWYTTNFGIAMIVVAVILVVILCGWLFSNPKPRPQTSGDAATSPNTPTQPVSVTPPAGTPQSTPPQPTASSESPAFTREQILAMQEANKAAAATKTAATPAATPATTPAAAATPAAATPAGVNVRNEDEIAAIMTPSGSGDE